MKHLLLILSVLLAASTAKAVPHSHKAKSGHAEKKEDGAYAGRHVGGEGHEYDHEAILGSHKEAEEYDELSPEESKRRLAILVKRMDLDSDKKVSKSELKDWIVNSFKSLSAEESRERYEDSDNNTDGFVTWQEYIAQEYDLQGDDTDAELALLKDDPDREEEFAMMEEERVIFKAADENGDGKLDEKEFFSFSHPEETPKMFPIVVDYMLRERDADGDKLITFDELIAPRKEGKDQAWIDDERSRFDEEMDLDKNGSLDPSEIQNWMMPANDDIAEEEVEHLFGEADEDNDGELSYEEIVDNHETFVGSEATDFGEHLDNIHRFTEEL